MKLINIGELNQIQNIDVVKIICSILDELILSLTNILKHYKQLITYVADRAGYDERYEVDASKIVKELDWIPNEAFETGIRKTIQWYLDNKTWCENRASANYHGERLGVIKL